MVSPPEHGGRLRTAAEKWGIPLEQWLDLSTGINPQGWSLPVIPEDVWRRLPEPDDGLEQAVIAWAGAPDDAGCIPVPGSQAAIMALPGLRRSSRVGVPVPGYREHGYWWARARHRVVGLSSQQVAGEDEGWLDDLDVLVWINPNNPDGQLVPPERLLRWCRQLQRRGGWLVVDEAFADGCEHISMARFTGMPGLVVMRSLGKFFGLAGLRAGAVLTESGIAAALADALGPWPLSGPARYLMALALADTEWQISATKRLRNDSDRLHQLLVQHGLPDSSGTLLFRYMPHPDARILADSLASQGILVRHFDSPPALRLGLPGAEAQWQKLEQALVLLANVIDR